MVSQLRDIPAEDRPGRRRPPLARDTWHDFEDVPRQTVLLNPRAPLHRPELGRPPLAGWDGGRRRRFAPTDALLALAVVAVVAFLGRGMWHATRVHVESTGLARRDALTYGEARHLDVRIKVAPAKGLTAAEITLDGEPLRNVEKLDHGFHWTPVGPMTAGDHELKLVVPRPMLPASTFTWKFLVDAKPPVLKTPRLLSPHGMRQPVRFSGSVDPDATLTANGDKVDLDDGHFTLEYAHPPAGPIRLVASDAAGHVVTREVFVPIKRPTVHGVHMSAVSWRTADLRNQIFGLIDSGVINTVELDLKDEAGEVGYDSDVPLAKQIGSVKRYYHLRDAIDELHRRGVRVVGRIVAFRDPILATAAWQDGHRDWVVQRPDGTPHGAYGGFANMDAPAVQQYNLDIASEAIDAGIDEILWDYIRRPEGDLTQIVFPGMPSTDGAVERGVVRFLAKGHELAREHGVFQGASVFGIAAGRPWTVGQNVPAIARHVDYIAPMVYPALWVPGEYHVPDPVHMPYDIVTRSLEDFQAKTKGTGIGITPWLQDFSLGTTYGDTQVRQQVVAAASLNPPVNDWLLWSPRVRYHAGELPKRSR
jgi:hypothetical protein